jgi:hypothetical protein
MFGDSIDDAITVYRCFLKAENAGHSTMLLRWLIRWCEMNGTLRRA